MMDSIGSVEDATSHAQIVSQGPMVTEGRELSDQPSIPSDDAGENSRRITDVAVPAYESPPRICPEEVTEKRHLDDMPSSASADGQNEEDCPGLTDPGNALPEADPARSPPGGSGTNASETMEGVGDGRRGAAVDSRETGTNSPEDRKVVDHTENCSQGGGASASPTVGSPDGGHQESLRANGEERAPGRNQQVGLTAPKKRKARRKASKHGPPHSHPPGMTTRGHPQSRLFCLSDFPEDICPMRRWPRAVRPERPVYPSCMEGVEEEAWTSAETESVAADEDSSSTSDQSESSASGDAAAVSSPFPGLESCVVPGALESVLVFCRTSPLLPGPLRPQPDHLRALLHDSCVLQCVLRGVGPVAMAGHLDSESFRKSATDFRELSDKEIFAGE